jgi:hypothetical protein
LKLGRVRTGIKRINQFIRRNIDQCGNLLKIWSVGIETPP